MKKYILMITISVSLVSCGIQTMSNIAGKMVNVGVDGMGAILKGIDKVYEKVQGKINPTRLNGSWELKEVYKGSYNDLKNISKDKLQNQYDEYNGDVYLYQFDMFGVNSGQIVINLFSNYKPDGDSPYSSTCEYTFDKTKETDSYENILKYGDDQYFYIINVNNEKLVIEQDFIPNKNGEKKSKAVLVFEKKKIGE